MALAKILIIEDSELLHRMYDLILLRYRREGTVVLHAYNGRDGLRMMTEHPDTALVLLDINMPIMSGLEFLQYAKKENILRDVPVIIISTEGKAEDTLRGLENGARAYVTKPFLPNDLYKIIEKVLQYSTPPALGDDSKRGYSGRPFRN